jgi:hypothetical protein
MGTETKGGYCLNVCPLIFMKIVEAGDLILGQMQRLKVGVLPFR